MDLKHLGGVINTNLTLPIGPLMLNTTLEPWFSLGSIYFGGFEGGVERWGGKDLASSNSTCRAGK